MGTLYLIATPIGNLEDVSARALRLLQKVSLIAAEDTRQTRKLLSHFDIHTPLTSYFEHNQRVKLDQVLFALENGDVALVSDAGTPALNDPGAVLVQAAIERGFPVSPIPGACAPIAALVASGLSSDSFLYLGYLPRKTGDRKKLLASVAGFTYTLIFLESPHRLVDSLADLVECLGSRQVAVARELTKIHEEFWRGSLAEAHQYFTIQAPRGEFTLIVEGAPLIQERWPLSKLQSALEQATHSHLSPSRLASHLATQSGWSKKDIYQQYTSLQRIKAHESGSS